MTKRSHSTYTETIQRYADEYLEETGKQTATTKEFAVWAVKTGRWEPPRDLVIKQCREDFARALREQYITNDKGQSVRAKHVARVTRDEKQWHLWADIRNAPREHMETAFQQRREQIVGDCRQLKRDVEYYNNANGGMPAIQLVFDFTDDIEEGGFSGEYPAKRPDVNEPRQSSTSEFSPLS